MNMARDNSLFTSDLKERFMTFLMVYLSLAFISGCIPLTNQQKIEKYNCYWGCPNELGETGWCCDKEVPVYDQTFFDCHNATPERTTQGAICPQ